MLFRSDTFPVFVHKTIIYKRENKRITKEERPTISGLVFVQGEARKVQRFLTENFFGLHLVKDCSTGRTASICDSVMQAFMQVARLGLTRIRFMPHTFDYYGIGNPLIRITTGVLSGLEGYRIRIARDKCFVTSMGGMTVAIGGIHKESFENLDEYVRSRRARLLQHIDSSYRGDALTPMQEKIDKCFFDPQTQLDVMAIAAGLDVWLAEAYSLIKQKDFDGAVEIILFILEEIGARFCSLAISFRTDYLGDMETICRRADDILQSIANSYDVSSDLKEIVATERESLAIRFPFLGMSI